MRSRRCVGGPGARLIAADAGGRPSRIRRTERHVRPDGSSRGRPRGRFGRRSGRGGGGTRPGGARRPLLRLPLRGRHREGRLRGSRGGLRLDRAGQALPDGDDGAVPGAHVPASLGALDRARDRGRDEGGRNDHRPATDRSGPARSGRRAPARARQPPATRRRPSRPRRGHGLGRHLAAGVRLRRSRRRGAPDPPRGRLDRRLPPRQVPRTGPRRRRLPRPRLPQPPLDPRADAHPLRRPGHGGRPDHGRRHRLPARRRDLLRHDDHRRLCGGPAVAALVARRVAAGGADHGPHRRARRDEPGRALARERPSRR